VQFLEPHEIMPANGAKKGGAGRAKPTQAKTEARTLKRKRVNDDLEKLKKAIDELVSPASNVSLSLHSLTATAGSQVPRPPKIHRSSPLRSDRLRPALLPLRSPHRCSASRHPTCPEGERHSRRSEDRQRQNTHLPHPRSRGAQPRTMDRVRRPRGPDHQPHP